MRGYFVYKGQEYGFHIENNFLCFSISAKEVKIWVEYVKENNFLFDNLLEGVDEYKQKVLIKTQYIKSIPPHTYGKKQYEIKVCIKYIINWVTKDETKLTPNGILVKLGMSSETITVPTEVSCEQWIYNNRGNQFIWRSYKQFSYDETINSIFFLINTCRFLCQNNQIGTLDTDLLYENEIVAEIKFYRINETYFNGNCSSELLRVLDIFSISQFNRIYEEVNKANIYMAHITNELIPTTITIGWFVTVMAAFEWESKTSVISRDSSKYDEIRKKIINYIDELSKELTGKVKKHLKNYVSAILYTDENIALSEKIKQVLENDKYKIYWEPIKEDLYQLYSEQSKSLDIARRLQQQRNDFAHGNLDKDINPLSVIDIKMLYSMVFILQLSKCDLEENEIKKCYDMVFPGNVFYKDKMIKDFNFKIDRRIKLNQ